MLGTSVCDLHDFGADPRRAVNWPHIVSQRMESSHQ
jgi:hypothetical protein